MIEALHIAANGLLRSERRAADLANAILRDTSAAANFSLENKAAPPDPSQAGTGTGAGSGTSTGAGSGTSTGAGSGARLSGGPEFGNLIQHMVDLKAEKNVFAANALAFRRIDETLGSLLDDKG